MFRLSSMTMERGSVLMIEAAIPSAAAFTRFPSGILSTSSDGVPHFFQLLSFQAVSFNPTLILLSIEHTTEAWSILEDIGSFAVDFSSTTESAVPDSTTAIASPTFHHPLSPESSGWVECVVDSVIDNGDRIIVLASMIEMDVHATEEPALDLSADQYPPLTKLARER